MLALPDTTNLPRACAAEAVGTFILVFLGLGAVHSAVLTNSLTGLWPVAMAWGIGVAIAIYCSGAASGAHLNPAITAAMAIFGNFNKKRIIPYWISQFAGAFAAAFLLYILYSEFLVNYESSAGWKRGEPASIATASCYGEYFPNPGLKLNSAFSPSITEITACAAEFVGTAILAFVIFALTRGGSAPGPGLAPIWIGFTISALISVLAPISQAGFNPARDFAPRLFAYFAGWGNVAIPGPRGGFFTVYILSPILGAIGGAGIWMLLFRPRAGATK